MFYEITFFIYLVYVFISKWVDYPLVRKIALITVAIAALYQLLYLLFLRRKDYISFGRCLGIGCFYTALVIFLMFLVFTVFAFLGGTNIAGLFSLEGFFEFYSLPFATDMPFGGVIVNTICLLYMFIYLIVTNRKAIKAPY